MKRHGEKIACLTAYDFPTAKLLDEAGIPLILVGDSLGMVVLGYPNTTHVTLADIEHHLRAVVRAQTNALIVADLPYQTYQSAEQAVATAQRLVQAGAQAVKAEGGARIRAQIEAIIQADIPFMGHLGMLPQHVLEEGGYHIKGKLQSERKALLTDLALLADLGAFAVVLELVKRSVAAEMTEKSTIPTIGIGSGPNCDGQILVTTDLFGTSPGFVPKHVKPNWNGNDHMRQALREWKNSVTHVTEVTSTP